MGKQLINPNCYGEGRFPHTFDGWNCPICPDPPPELTWSEKLNVFWLYWFNRLLDLLEDR